MKTLSIVFFILIFATTAICENEKGSTFNGLKHLDVKNKKTAYIQFINEFLVVSPHPDKETNDFIIQAKHGDTDSFCLIAYYIWSGHAGFIKEQLSSKFALIRGLNDGSNQAPFWIAYTFFNAKADSDKNKIENYMTGIHWLGVSAGLGESRSHDKAMEVIDMFADINAESKEHLILIYNDGLESSKQYKKAKKIK